MRIIILVLILLGSFAPPAGAFCGGAPSMYESAPSLPYVSKPSPPFCMANYQITRTHTCDRWQIDSYFDEVDDYIQTMIEYANESVAFANAAIDFSTSARNFAECEIEEVKSEIQ